jgi:glucokinase
VTYYAGIDLGASNIRAAIATADGTVVALDRRPTPTGPDGAAVTAAILEALRTACAELSIDPAEINSAGIGSVGPLDLAAGTVENPANLADPINQVQLYDPVANLIDGPVSIHNDAIAGVIGERYYSRHTPDDMIYLTISSGIGAGIAVDGQVLRGWDGNAGEVGHMIVDPAGRMTCGCGHDGHWEAYCSGENIPPYARQLADTTDIGTSLPLDSPEFAAADIFAAPDDPPSDHVIDRIARWNAIGVTNLIHAFAPLVIVIGGAVALRNESLVIDVIRDRVPDLVFTNVPEIRPTDFGEEVVMRGAIASAITRVGR